MERYFMKYCSNGHRVYAKYHTPQDEHCSFCGEALFDECPSCGEGMPNIFQAVEGTNGRPLGRLPNPPEFCSHCGSGFPWAASFMTSIEQLGIWGLLHPRVCEVSKSRFESGHYADAVEAALKELNAKVKSRVRERKGIEDDGKSLMFRAFSGDDPAIVVGDETEESGRNIQEGYMHLFAGAMQAIRNPKAHSNLNTPKDKALHLLFLASLLFMKIDEELLPKEAS